jgi:iron complex transport system substrate-binding protein
LDRAADEPPGRIISLAPNFTEIAYALGAEDRLVAVTDYCKFPPEAATKPKVGSLLNLSYERVLGLRPDLALLLPAHAEMGARLERLGVATKTIRTESIDDVYAAIEAIGAVVKRSGESKRLIDRLKQDLKEVAEAGRSRNGRTPDRDSLGPRVLFVIGRNPGSLQQIYACGSGSYLDELLSIVGARNVLTDTATPWPTINLERILALNPDIILDGSIRAGEAPIDGDAHMRAWDRLESLDAVRRGRVVAVESEHLMIPGPWIAEGARMLAELIHGPSPEGPRP